MHYLNRFIFFALLLTLSGCQSISNNQTFQMRDREYLQAKSIPPLNIPPGLSSSTVSADYPVSERNYPESAKEVSLIPPELNK